MNKSALLNWLQEEYRQWELFQQLFAVVEGFPEDIQIE
jgi:hypothetical protein